MTALKPIAALPRYALILTAFTSYFLTSLPALRPDLQAGATNSCNTYSLTAYIDRLRPRPPPHQAAPFALGTHVPILNAAQLTRLCATALTTAPTRTHILRVASTTRARSQSSPPEARNQGSVSHPPRVNAPLRTNRAKPAAACYQTVMQPEVNVLASSYSLTRETTSSLELALAAYLHPSSSAAHVFSKPTFKPTPLKPRRVKLL
ncbi:hypothetical protein B0H16DRAFT_1883227 [Mycena metata]|uniref:Uncharacterized protein n=1 Tax=Mycena metata TaxID=1033252 RepID=A0AAD7JLR9_9AGAR|nr:hypothetical protein B0H16DRAFT_1883227 [Mycena metata]